MTGLRAAVASAVLASLVLGCAGAGSASPVVSVPPSAAPSLVVASAEAAAALALAQDPSFATVRPKNPDMIGGCCFYEVAEQAGGYVVTIEMGWGDCQAGCIERHRWAYAVSRIGEVGLIAESGDPVPAGGVPAG